MLFRILIWAFILAMVFRFITRYLFPILKITRATRDGLRRMQDHVEQMNQQQGGQQYHQKPPVSTTTPVKEGDYIDYEEVK
jgi:hypothetical protein